VAFPSVDFDRWWFNHQLTLTVLAPGKACPHFGKRGVVEFFAQQSQGVLQ